MQDLPWRRGNVVIASASETEDLGFESRQGVRFLGRAVQCCLENCHCVYLRKINASKFF
jgi:hypothetical protein